MVEEQEEHSEPSESYSTDLAQLFRQEPGPLKLPQSFHITQEHIFPKLVCINFFDPLAGFHRLRQQATFHVVPTLLPPRSSPDGRRALSFYLQDCWSFMEQTSLSTGHW